MDWNTSGHIRLTLSVCVLIVVFVAAGTQARLESNTALNFGGTNAYVTFGRASGLGSTAFTIEAWFKRKSAGTAASTGTGGVTAIPLVAKGRGEADNSAVDMNYFLGIRQSDGVLVADLEEGATGTTPGLNHPVIGVTPIQYNTWYHAAATYNGTWQLYLNGVPDGAPVVAGQPPRWDSIQHAAVGTALNSTGTPSGFFAGTIDEVRIWNYARTAQQISSAMSTEISGATGLLGRWGLNEGSGTVGTNSVANGINGTVIGSNWSWTSGAPFAVSSNRAPNPPALNFPLNSSGSVSTSPSLNVSVSDPDNNKMTVTFFGRVAGSAPNFTLMTIPDTQHYVDSTANAPIFPAQTRWIVTSRPALNTVFVTHLGDMSEHIDQSPVEWGRVDAAMNTLDTNDIPNNESPGNHDISPAGVANFFDQYFPPSRYLGKPWYGGYLGQSAGEPNRQNKDNYELFSVGSLNFVIVHLEADFPSYSLTWADKILKQYANRRAIISSHMFLNDSGRRPGSKVFRTDGTSAEQVWQQLIKTNCNVFLVLNGHYSGENRRTDLNNCAQPVHQVVQDYQSRVNGGDGWLRYFTFKPAENKVDAYTFSPTRNGGLGQFENDANSRFTLDYTMQGGSFGVLGVRTGVSSGSIATWTWPTLTPNTQYEWYVTANDGQLTTTGPVWSFVTAP